MLIELRQAPLISYQDYHIVLLAFAGRAARAAKAPHNTGRHDDRQAGVLALPPAPHPPALLLSLLTDSLARSSIRHLRVNSRCLIGSPQRRNSYARAGTGQACGVPLHATAAGQRALACVPGRCARAHALGVHAVMAWVPAINRSRT